MGCDIHLYVEKKGYEGEWCFAMDEDVSYGDRNYEVFSVLANVRNRYDIKPISEPRGLPDDMSSTMGKIASEQYEHSATWLTLKEVETYDWDQKFCMKVMCQKEAYEEWKKNETSLPKEWCTWTNVEDAKEIQLTRSCRDACRGFLTWIENLKEASFDAKHHPENIRFVFWFDS